MTEKKYQEVDEYGFPVDQEERLELMTARTEEGHRFRCYLLNREQFVLDWLAGKHQ